MKFVLAAVLARLATAAKTKSSLKPRFLSEGLDLASERSSDLPSFYHTTEEIHDELKELAGSCPGMSLRSASKTSLVGGRSIELDVVSIKAKDEEPKNKFFVLFGEHARELISAESGLHFVKTLCSGSARAREGLRNSEFMIVVNANPDSRKTVEKGDWCVRMNPNGVDLNRNWDEHWQESISMGADTSPGAAPFSEPETQILKELVTEYGPTSFLTIHSGTLGMYMPWAFDMKHLASRNQPQMMEILKKVDEAHCECPYGAAGKEVGYSCPGTCLDWVFDKLKTPYSFAYEIYVGGGREDLKARWQNKINSETGSYLQAHSHLANDHFKDLFDDFPSSFIQLNTTNSKEERKSDMECFGLFNPPTKDEFEETVENWAMAYLDTGNEVAKRLA
jgi:hypothetical protein